MLPSEVVNTRQMSTIGQALALVVLASCTARANLITVATNLGPGDTFQGNSIMIENYLIPGEVTGFAAAFVPNTTATLLDVFLPLSAQFGGSLTAAVLSDAGGLPGSIIASLTQDGSIPENPGLVEFTCSDCPQLQANSTYWIAAVTANLDTNVFWNFSPTALGNASFSNNFANVGVVNGPWYTAGSTFPTPGFVVEADSSAPEPSSIIMALLGFGGLALRRVWWPCLGRLRQG